MKQIRSFLRLPLHCLHSVNSGVFILSTLSAAARDPVENYGFALKYHMLEGEGAVVSKENTYSMRTKATKRSSRKQLNSLAALITQQAAEERTIIFKAMRRDLTSHGTSSHSEGQTGQHTIQSIVSCIRSVYADAAGDVLPSTEQPIRSLAEAEGTETILARLRHSLTHLIWL